MKNRIFKSIFALVLAFVALPMMGQDYLNVCFKKGESRKILLRNVTGIATSKSDDEGNISSDYHYLHISTEYNKYVYNLDDIDCISYKKCSESEVEGNMVNSYNALFPILDACESISDVEKRMEDIKDAEAVENAWSDGRYLYVKIKDGDTMSFCFNDEPDDEDNDDLDAKLSVLSSQIKSKIKKAESSGKENLKVAIVNQAKFNMHPSYVNGQNRLEKIGNLFKDIGITPTYVNPSLDFFYSGIFNYDVVILCTHGNVRILNDKSDYERDKDGDPIHTLCTSDVVGEHIGSNPSDGGEIVQQWKNTRNIIVSDKPYGDKIFNNENVGLPVEWHQELRDNLLIWVGYIAITENFFKYVSEGAFPDKSIMFAAVCHSNQGSSSLSRKLRNKNLGSYLGFDNQVRTSVATKAALSFFTSMMTGKSIEESYREMPDGYAYDWLNGASLFPYGFWSNFLFPTVTKQIEQTTAQNAFNSSGYVEVEGFTTCIDPNADDAVKMGFQYSTNEYFSPASSIVSSDVSKLTKPLDNGNGNVQFRAKLTDLQPGNTYFYRAYTYDGMNYNYGKPCSFEIEQSGGGIVAYTSCPDDNHPHLIDLGLPSGTKWACCNVGASKPEEYGGYYAWGETTEKDYYKWSTYIHCDGSFSTCHDIGKDIAGTQYDAATVNWGSPWVMPSNEQMEELNNNCTSEWTTENGVNGRRFTGPNGASIFLPAAGYGHYEYLHKAGSWGNYWSSSLYESDTDYAWRLNFYSGLVWAGVRINRYYGQSVRPVRKN